MIVVETVRALGATRRARALVDQAMPVIGERRLEAQHATAPAARDAASSALRNARTLLEQELQPRAAVVTRAFRATPKYAAIHDDAGRRFVDDLRSGLNRALGRSAVGRDAAGRHDALTAIGALGDAATAINAVSSDLRTTEAALSARLHRELVVTAAVTGATVAAVAGAHQVRVGTRDPLGHPADTSDPASAPRRLPPFDPLADLAASESAVASLGILPPPAG